MIPSTQVSDTRTLSGFIIGLSVLGIALLIANITIFPLWNGNLELFLLMVLPLVISLIAYVRFAESIVWWEVGLLAIWGGLTIAVTVFIGFLATMGMPESYTGAGAELIRKITMFLAATLGLSIPYGLAGKYRREYPLRTIVSALLASVILLILFNAVAIAI